MKRNPLVDLFSSISPKVPFTLHALADKTLDNHSLFNNSSSFYLSFISLCCTYKEGSSLEPWFSNPRCLGMPLTKYPFFCFLFLPPQTSVTELTRKGFSPLFPDHCHPQAVIMLMSLRVTTCSCHLSSGWTVSSLHYWALAMLLV